MTIVPALAVGFSGSGLSLILASRLRIRSSWGPLVMLAPNAIGWIVAITVIA